MALGVGVNGASCDAQTLQVQAIWVTSNNVNDATVVPQLLAQLSPDEPLLTG